MAALETLRRLLPGLWLGFLLCIAAVAAPAPFATLFPADAARVAARVLAQEAYASLIFGVLLLVAERLAARRNALLGVGSQFTLGMALCLAALFCTLSGYFAVQPMMPAARAGQGLLSFGQLHLVSACAFALKIGFVAALAWRALPVAISRPTAS